MIFYKLTYRPSVLKKDLKKITKTDLQKILIRIEALAKNPRPPHAKQLTNRPEWRVRQGKYRILYLIDEQQIIVLVVKVSKQEDAYK